VRTSKLMERCGIHTQSPTSTPFVSLPGSSSAVATVWKTEQLKQRDGAKRELFRQCLEAVFRVIERLSVANASLFSKAVE
jgi:hypothetical protein